MQRLEYIEKGLSLKDYLQYLHDKYRAKMKGKI